MSVDRAISMSRQSYNIERKQTSTESDGARSTKRNANGPPKKDSSDATSTDNQSRKSNDNDNHIDLVGVELNQKPRIS